MRGKYSGRISALDPVHECREIVFLLTCFEFSWDIERALEFALFRTYAVPAISGLLDKTGEFARPTYPEGYRVEELGTFRKHPRKAENRHGTA